MATALLSPSASFFNNGQLRIRNCASIPPSKSNLKSFRVRALKEKTEEIESPSSSSSASAEEVAKKYGLEAGLWKVPISSLVRFFSFCLFLLCGPLRLSISFSFYYWLMVIILLILICFIVCLFSKFTRYSIGVNLN